MSGQATLVRLQVELKRRLPLARSTSRAFFRPTGQDSESRSFDNGTDWSEGTKKNMRRVFLLYLPICMEETRSGSNASANDQRDSRRETSGRLAVLVGTLDRTF